MTPATAANLAGRFRALARQRDPILDDSDRAHLVELLEHFQDEERKERRRLAANLASGMIVSGDWDERVVGMSAFDLLEALEAEQQKRAANSETSPA